MTSLAVEWAAARHLGPLRFINLDNWQPQFQISSLTLTQIYGSHDQLIVIRHWLGNTIWSPWEPGSQGAKLLATGNPDCRSYVHSFCNNMRPWFSTTKDSTRAVMIGYGWKVLSNNGFTLANGAGCRCLVFDWTSWTCWYRDIILLSWGHCALGSPNANSSIKPVAKYINGIIYQIARTGIVVWEYECK